MYLSCFVNTYKLEVYYDIKFKYLLTKQFKDMKI